MPAIDAVITMLRDLDQADQRLQSMLVRLKKAYYAFVYAPLKKGRKVNNQLFMRSDLDGQERIRRLFFSGRTSAVRYTASGRKIRLSNRLRGPWRDSWIYNVARDWRHKEVYKALERWCSKLNRLRKEVVRDRRSLLMTFVNGWARQATDTDRAQAARILERESSYLIAPHLVALVGAVIFSRHLESLGTQMALLVEEYRAAFRGRSDVSFEPAVRTNGNGFLRLYWGFPQIVRTRQGTRRFTDYIPGRPTDLWMRKYHLSPRTCKEVGAFLKRLLPIQEQYQKHLAFLATHRRRVGEVLARVVKVDATFSAALAEAEGDGPSLGDPGVCREISTSPSHAPTWLRGKPPALPSTSFNALDREVG